MVVVMVAVAFAVALHMLDRDRVVDKGDTDIEDSAMVVAGIAKHKGMPVVVHVMAWVDAMVSVVANRQAF
jgi:hypothetical protein